ncbi:MAG: AcrB/AcrD/AcrF family protein [Bdellovibrio sp.]|nr:MAG: AcrB/AcrD/AcrF family protein [Bdellovibrio sp.]
MNLSELSIRRPIFITCVVGLMLIVGYTSLRRMSVDLFPDVTFPVIFIQTPYPGASPVDMEKLVSKPIEDELGSLAGLNRITSQNADSISSVILEFKIGTDIKDAEQQVRQRLGNIRNNLPDEIKNPVIRRFDPSDQAVVRLAVTSQMDAAQLFDIVDELVKGRFETLSGVGQVLIIGGRKREIQVLVDRYKLQDRKLAMIQVAEKIANTSKDVPVGRVDTSKQETVMRASGEFESVDALKKVNINFVGSDQVVPLQSIAEIKEGLEEERSRTSLMLKSDGYKRRPALYLDVFKQSGANTVAVVDAVKLKVDSVNQLLKQRGYDIQVETVRDSARPIRLNLKDVSESITYGILLCVFVVMFFLGSFRSTFITGMALPNSLLGGFVLMGLMGFTINILTLLALSLAVGLLIDDAIVVRENIFRHIEMGKTPMQAALDGTKEVALAVIATTLVVIAVFGPIAFLEGMVGQFFRQFGLTVCFTMLISLFDAFTVAPMLSAYMAGPAQRGRQSRHGLQKRFILFELFDRLQEKIEDLYALTLGWVIRHRLATLFLAGVVFVASMALVKFISKTFLPTPDNGEFLVQVELPVGASLDATQSVVTQIEEQIKANPAVELISAVIGSNSGARVSNQASIYLRLVPRNARAFSTSQVKQQFREEFNGKIKDVKVSVADIDIGGGAQKPLNVNIFGDDLDELAKYADKFKARVEKIPGLVDVDTNYRTGKPEFHIVFDRARSEALGVSTIVAGRELRARVEGMVPSTYRRNGKEYDIRVRLAEKDRDLRQVFATTEVPNVNFDKIPLRKIARGEETEAFSQINRSNKSRYINIESNLGANASLGNISTEIENLLTQDQEYKLPNGLSYRFQGQAEDFKDLMNNMVAAMGLGVIFIYLVLSSLYESFITPFAILLALPLALSGAMTGLFVTGKSIDIFSLIGIVMLLGVVAKNSILLVDYTNQLMDEGVPRDQALLRAGRTRLRPILMTSLALIAGTIPVAVGLNEASAQRTSMGVAIIGGLISSTLLTLIVVPASFGYIDGFRRWIRQKFRGSKPSPPNLKTVELRSSTH